VDLLRALVATLGVAIAGIVYGAEAGSDAGADVLPTAAAPEVRLGTIEVIAERFDKARNALSPKTGTSQFVFDRRDIIELPQGENTPLNQVLLQAPGVAQGDYGELHIRGEMTQPQYRINGTIIPEGISGFGQVFDSRFAQRIEFITGALPAQYNYRTNIIDITTRQSFENGGRVSIYGGSSNTQNPALELSGATDKLTYYTIGSYLQADNGILFPTADRQAIHDDTIQRKGFARVSFVPDPRSRWSVMVGAAKSQFQIPNVPGETPIFPLDSVSYFPNLPSVDLDENQQELNRYAVISYEGNDGANLDYQVAFFARYSNVLFTPDPDEDLIYRGIASRVARTNRANGLQVDSSLEHSETHTVRAGFSFSRQRTNSENNSGVFPADSEGNQVPGAPFAVIDSRSIAANLAGIYAQDEWRASRHLPLNYGLRFDYLDGLTRDSQVSPRLNTVYKFDDRKDDLSAYFNAAVAWARAKGISSGQYNFGRDEVDYIDGHWVYMDHDQRLTSSAGVAYTWSKVLFLADAFFGSGMRSTPVGGTPNSDHLPAYLQVNVGVAREIQASWPGKLGLRLSIVNVFDKSYEIRDGTGVGVGAPQFGPRRSIYGALSATF
jgi:hypothetical protein